MRSLFIVALSALAILVAAAGGASAECYAHYKAKKDQPLRLHYGIMQLADKACDDRKRATRIVARRLDGAGWRLLNVLSLTRTPPTDEQRANAGKFYLRF